MIDSGVTFNLGDILLAYDFISRDQLREALAIQRRSTPYKRLGQILVSKGYATREQIRACLAKQQKFSNCTATTQETAVLANYAAERLIEDENVDPAQLPSF
jgi:hypothetical protein